MNGSVGRVTPGQGPPINLTEPATPLAAPSWQTPRETRWTARDLTVRLFYRMKLFVFCVLLGLLAGVAAAALSSTVFTADSVMIVLLGSDSAVVQDPLNLGNTQISVDGLKAIQSEVQIIQAEGVILSAITEIGPTRLYPALTRARYLGLLPPANGSEQIGMAIERFRGSLRVEAQGSSNAIRVSFSHPSRELAISALSALTSAYLAQRRTIYANNNTPMLGQEVGRYSARLTQIEADIQRMRQKYDVLGMAQDILVATNRLDGIVQRQSQVQERRAAVETEIAAVRAKLSGQPQTILDFRETTNLNGNDDARSTLLRLMLEREHLAARYNQTWPALQEVDKKIATVRAQIGAGSRGLYFTERTIRNPSVEMLNNRLASLEIENQALGQQLVELDEQARGANERIKALREADGPLHTLQLNRDVVEGIYRQLSLRQSEPASGDGPSVGRNETVRIAQPPAAPLRGHSLAVTYVIGGAFFGLLLGIAAVAIVTMLRQVYILPAEAERDLGLPNLGEVDADEPGRGVADIWRGYGVLASNLLSMSIDDKPLSMVQIVSLSRTDDMEEVVRGLATEFAGGFAMRTLILDLVGILPPAGPPGGTLRDPAQEIQVAVTDQENLWISVDARRELFGNRGQMLARASQIISSLRQRFEMVLVIAPFDPAEATIRRVAGIVDANVLVLRAEETRGVIAARFREIILAAGGNLAGFVFVGRKLYVPAWLYRRV